MKLNRRKFLGGVTLAAGTAQLPSVLLAAPLASAAVSSASQRAVFQQQLYADYSGAGEVYTKPAAVRSTQDYVASLSHEEFLRRHWFR
ncbi:MAG: hypothetical protein V4603_16965 [Pseudomonadota bacterium]